MGRLLWRVASSCRCLPAANCLLHFWHGRGVASPLLAPRWTASLGNHRHHKSSISSLHICPDRKRIPTHDRMQTYEQRGVWRGEWVIKGCLEITERSQVVRCDVRGEWFEGGWYSHRLRESTMIKYCRCGEAWRQKTEEERDGRAGLANVGEEKGCRVKSKTRRLVPDEGCQAR
jgi:hypothetical protein